MNTKKMTYMSLMVGYSLILYIIEGYIPKDTVNITSVSNIKNSLLFKSGIYWNQLLMKKEPAKNILLNVNFRAM